MQQIKIWILCIFIISLSPYELQAFEYFNRSIDYWNEKEPVKKEIKPIPIENVGNRKKTKSYPHDNLMTQESADQNHRKFNWDTYLNPQTMDDLREVFREGNHIPPTPLLEVTMNPTDKNIKNWLELVRRKNQFFTRLNQKMADYLNRNKGS